MNIIGMLKDYCGMIKDNYEVVLFSLAFIAVVATVLYLLYRLALWIGGKRPEYMGPRCAVYLQKGDVRGWVKAFDKEQPLPVLTTDAFERLVCPVKTIADDINRLYHSGWVVCVHCGLPREWWLKKEEGSDK